jgi:D-tagatose-1,6-bisphosphate aldolase subunit GatZ/KbaZ
MHDPLRDVIARNRHGQPVSIPSVCSAHRDVLRASMMLAADLGQPIIIEATSNQVNQFGGYTGMRAADFAAVVHKIAAEAGLPRRALVLGGDHLGPQVWRREPAHQAMAHAATLVAEYARAGFTKIHLDCSAGCANEAAQVDDATAAQRSAVLAAACLAAAPDQDRLSFVIGTEVPPPGGAHDAHMTPITPTSPARVQATLAAHRAAFADAGLGAVWPQVCGLVVQPGVEFSPTAITHLPETPNTALRAALGGWDGIVYEAHSTDYQHPGAFGRMAAMGFAIQKVGPALTFAWRQAVYGLDMILQILGDRSTPLCEVAERAMLRAPSHWQSHYDASDAAGLRALRHFSYADRIRYYWADPEVATAVSEMFDRLAGVRLTGAMMQQAFSPTVIAAAQALIPRAPDSAQALVLAQVQAALRPYFTDHPHD